jgi:uncharacterized paraquat-inducible protein A
MKRQTQIHKPNRADPWKPIKPLICADEPEREPAYCKKCRGKLSEANRARGICFRCQSAELDKRMVTGKLKGFYPTT